MMNTPANMRAARFHKKDAPVSIDEAPVPSLRPGDALIRVKATGITRDELTWGPTSTHKDGSSRLPSIPGHELAGIIEKIMPPLGSKAVGLAAHPPGALKEGDKVYGL